MSSHEKAQPKPGRTLLVKPNSNSFDESVLTNLSGLVDTPHKSEKTNSWFLTFDTSENSETAYKYLSELDNLRVKYALYKVYCKFENLNEDNNYNDVKTVHINLLEGVEDTKVLYYKLYRRNDNYLGCGELTVDTKKSFDYLLNSEDGMKSLSLGNNLNVTHFRFQRKPKSDMRNNVSSYN